MYYGVDQVPKNAKLPNHQISQKKSQNKRKSSNGKPNSRHGMHKKVPIINAETGETITMKRSRAGTQVSIIPNFYFNLESNKIGVGFQNKKTIFWQGRVTLEDFGVRRSAVAPRRAIRAFLYNNGGTIMS